MAEESEVIRNQMDETRSALAEKLEILENQVTGTVLEATEAVSESVGNVKEAVETTVQAVQESVRDAVESVKDAFDLRAQVAAHPWIVMGGAAALGFLGGCLTRNSASRQQATAPEQSSASTSRSSDIEHVGAAAEPVPTSSPRHPSWTAQLEEVFGEELKQVKGLALGTLMSLARDLVVKAAPPQMASQLSELADNLTVKLGGQPMHGKLLPVDTAPGGSEAKADHNGWGCDRNASRELPSATV